MALEMTVFDPVRYLVDAEEMAAYLEDAYRSGSSEVFADALEDVARACGRFLEHSEDESVRSSPNLEDVLKILRDAGVAMRFVPAAAA